MDDGIRKWIEGSIGAGEILRVVYLGGSHPGAVREIVPLNIYDDGAKLWAMDVNPQGKRIRKSFSMDKIVLPTEQSEPIPVPPPSLWGEYESLKDLVDKTKDILIGMGYEVRESEGCVELFEGKKKTPEFTLMYSDQVLCSDDELAERGATFNEETFEWELPPGVSAYKPAQRPWLVRKRRGTPVRYKLFSSAAKAFLERAER